MPLAAAKDPPFAASGDGAGIPIVSL